jgi:hypothetical protein
MLSCTAPGGYVEVCENSVTIHCDDGKLKLLSTDRSQQANQRLTKTGTMKPDHGVLIFCEKLREALRKMGRPHPDIGFLKNQLEKAGFEDIQMLQAKEPIGPWPKEPRLKKIGAMTLLNAETGCESYGMAAFTRVLEMDADEARDICRRAVQASQNKNYHTYSY